MRPSSSAIARRDPYDAGELAAGDGNGQAAPPVLSLSAVDGGSDVIPDGEPGLDHKIAGRSITAGDEDLEILHLRRRLETMPVIEQSKGILIHHYGVDADTAFDLLRQWACDNNLKLRDISQQVVIAATGSNDPRPTLSRFLLELRSRVTSTG